MVDGNEKSGLRIVSCLPLPVTAQGIFSAGAPVPAEKTPPRSLPDCGAGLLGKGGEHIGCPEVHLPRGQLAGHVVGTLAPLRAPGVLIIQLPLNCQLSAGISQ